MGSGKSEEGRSEAPAKVGHLPPLHITKGQWTPISALNKMNIDFLKEQFYNAVITKQLNLEGTIVANVRHYEALQKAYESLDRVMRGLGEEVTSDFVAMDIRGALHYLGEITGEISADDLLGNIFGRFCIGK